MRRPLVLFALVLACGATSETPGETAGGGGDAAKASSGGGPVSSSAAEATSSASGMTGSGGATASSGSGGAAPKGPRYDEVRGKAVHNAYERFEGLFDQLAFHRVRALELDIHPTKGKWPDVAGDWYVYHDANNGETSCHRLSDCLDAVASFDRTVPDHEVVTLLLDLKANLVGTGHSPSDLDARLAKHFDADTLFTPADLAALCPGATSLRDAVTGSCGWPRLEALRGKVMVVLTGGSTCGSGGPMGYVDGGSTALTRKAFVAPEITSDCGWPKLAEASGAVFANMSYAQRSHAKSVGAAGLVSRVWSANDAGAWDSLVAAGTHLLATDKVNASVDPWSRTHAPGGWPFACMAEPCDPPATESVPAVRLDVRSGDIWGEADGMTFVSRKSDTKARSLRGFVSVASSHVDAWAKGCIMARASLAPDAAYAAVCRPADVHPLRFQFRAKKGGSSTAKSVPVVLPDTIDAVDAPFVRLDVASGGTSATAYGSADGTSWVVLGTQTFDEPLVHQGLAASGHGSPETVRFVFGDLTITPDAPASPLALGDFPSQAAIGDCSFHAAADGTGD